MLAVLSTINQVPLFKSNAGSGGTPSHPFIAHYQFSSADDGTDSTTNGYTANANNGCVNNTRSRTGGYALTSDWVSNSTKYLALPNMPLYNSSNGWSISFWCYIPSSIGTVAGDDAVFGQSTSICYLVHNANNSKFRFMGNASMPINLVDCPLDQWNHIVIAVSASGVSSGWSNKVACFTGFSAGSNAVPTTMSGFEIGRRGTSLASFKGSIDDVRIYNSVLTQTDVNTIYAL